MIRFSTLLPACAILAAFGGETDPNFRSQRHTTVSICKDAFHLNGQPTYAGRTWKGLKIEGLLMNSRMVQGAFDDLNPETRFRWAYPDTSR